MTRIDTECRHAWVAALRTTSRWLAPAVLLVVPVQASAGLPAPAGREAGYDEVLTGFLDRAYAAQLRLSPEGLTRQGIREAYDRLDDYRPQAGERRLRLFERQVREMERRFDRARLGTAGRTNFDLFRRMLADARLEERWRSTRFAFTALRAPTTDIPVFLINNHRIDSLADAEAYVARLADIERVMREVADDHRGKVARGVIEPRFMFAPAIAAARGVITGAPFTDGPDSILWADFKAKLAKLDADPAVKALLQDRAATTLRGSVRRGYEDAIASLEAASRLAVSDDGVWRLPGGKDYYIWAVRRNTTTLLSPDDLHAIGLAELKKSHEAMAEIARSLGGHGTLRDFLAQMRADPKLYYPNDDRGREQYLTDARGVLADARRKASGYFGRLPNAPLEVRAVERWREATAPVAFYDEGSTDGTRPGIYYVNLRDLTQVLKSQLTGVACHEGVPGHHFQAAYVNAAKGLPAFRRRAYYGAYSEGWGLYSEELCKEMGVYKDGYSLFSRLSGDALRSARIVVDTGVNAKGWSRDKAMAFLRKNTLLSEGAVQSEVSRYLTEPAQATSYKIGQRKIIELRAKAAAALGSAFDIKEFHDMVLGGGGMPLDMLETRVDAFIADHEGAGASTR